MDRVINEIIEEIKAETGLTKYEIERIVDSEFKTLTIAIEDRDIRSVNLIYIGKIIPSKWLLSNNEIFQINKRYTGGLDKPLNKEEESGESSREQNINM